MKKKQLFAVVMLLLCTCSALACTSAIVSGRLTANGRPLLWKNRDTDDQNNRVKRIVAQNGRYEYVALFDAKDVRDTAAWMGYNEKGFAIMNTASYNLNNDDVKDMDHEGELMRKALEVCASVDEFEALLNALSKPLRVEANFGVIDAHGNGAFFETGNYSYRKYALDDAPDGILTRTNYSYSGRVDGGKGYIREQNAKKLLAPHLLRRDFTPAVFTEELSKTFYHSLLDVDFTHSNMEWLVDQDFIARSYTTATTVIEGVVLGENPLLTTMWIALGYPPCAEVAWVWLGEDGVPVELQGTAPDNHAPQCDKVNEREKEVFSIGRGSGERYLNLSKLYNCEGTGYCQRLIPLNMETYRKGYAELEKRRKSLEGKNKKSRK